MLLLVSSVEGSERRVERCVRDGNKRVGVRGCGVAAQPVGAPRLARKRRPKGVDGPWE
jgi:hypothetical protein